MADVLLGLGIALAIISVVVPLTLASMPWVIRFIEGNHALIDRYLDWVERKAGG